VVESALPAGPQPRWAVDPTQAGPNLPPVGRSLFDFAMVEPNDGKLAYDIPFPFDALVCKVEQRAGCAGSDGSCIKQILIPRGRHCARGVCQSQRLHVVPSESGAAVFAAAVGREQCQSRRRATTGECESDVLWLSGAP